MGMVHLDGLYPLLSEKNLSFLTILFRNELIAALHNQSSSLPAILNPIYKLPARSGTGVALSIGGTNGYMSHFRISQNGVVTFLTRILFSLPKQTTKQELFHILAREIQQVTSKGKKQLPVGIGFAYPLRPLLHQGFIDGQLVKMTKGREIAGLVGKNVGQEFHRFLIENYHIDTTVAVANDAICLLLGGDGVEVAGVVGTGLNFAYWDKRANVAPLKLSELAGYGQAEVAVNIESANFDKIPATILRDSVDKKSDNPGRAISEKEVAGAYLYQIFNAGKDTIVETSFPILTSTDQLNDILTNAFVYPQHVDSEAKKRAKQFAERIFHRSAQIVAIELCGILMKIGKTKGIIPIVMEGGIFWKAKNYPALVNLYMNMMLPEVIPSFARLFGSSRRGIAILAMSAQS